MSVRGAGPKSPSRILVAIGDPTLRDRALRSVRGLADEIEDVASHGDGWTNVPATRERLALAVGCTTRTGPTSPAWVEALRARAPLMHIVLCTTCQEVPTAQLALFARAGVDDICFLDDPLGERELRVRLGDRLKHTFPPEVGTHVELCAAPASGRGRAVELWCARNAYRPLRVASVADHFGVNRKTLYRNARDVGWRDLQAVLGCARLLHVAVALWYTAAPVDRISRRLRFGSAAALHKLVKRYTGRTPIQLRQTDAVGIAAARWRSRGRSVEMP